MRPHHSFRSQFRSQMRPRHGQRGACRNLPTPCPAPAFGMGAPPLPTFFLLLLLLAGFVPPVAAQSPPAASLQPGGMLTMREHAVLTDEHLDATPGTDGLLGAQGVAASGDLLFVTAEASDALSVWRVNAEAGTLTQTQLHQDITTGSLMARTTLQSAAMANCYLSQLTWTTQSASGG